MKRSQLLKPGRGYHVGVSWGGRAETPEELAARWLRLISRLEMIDPVFAHWYKWAPVKRALPLDTQVGPLAERIAASLDPEEDVPQVDGYQLFAHNTAIMKRGPRNFEIHMDAGSWVDFPPNGIGIGTDYGVVPDPDVVTYKIFRGALLALAETFEAAIGSAYPSSLVDLWPKETGRGRLILKLAWITYVGPKFAHLIAPPASAIVERRPDGGLLMAATDETFVASNPRHMAVAREIEAALAPFNELPLPHL